jgi:hypothetical protein
MTSTFYPDGLQIHTERGLGAYEFACDLSVCKGACCTMPADRGAPILPKERGELERIFPLVRHRLHPDAVHIAESIGVWQRESDGTYTIPTIGGAECIFVEWDGDVAKCAIQNAYHAGEVTEYEKPISCHLFPIRINYEAEDRSVTIYYEQIDECSGGRSNGAVNHIPLVEFLSSPLVRAFGKDRTHAIIEHTLNNASS